MSSFNNFVLLLLLTFTLILVIESAEERRAIPSEEEKKELERQLKVINKPAIKSFKVDPIACTGLSIITL
ncbi:hypothetical protein Bca4012_087816 [Brassica carinata]|uniref:Neprosin activation peptide domain-containing protein n=1 Tax=Brassica oleracea var. oleracea TaxID=109376 RepID=A0A0D3A5I8_BRAOL